MTDYKADAKASQCAKLAKYADGGAIDAASRPNNYRYGWQRRTGDGIRTDTPSWGRNDEKDKP